MNKIIVNTLAIVTISAFAQAQTPSGTARTNINSPNFLVHQQLSPELIKIEYAAGLTSGTFENSAGQEVSRFKTNTLTVSGYPATLINKPHQQLYMGFGYVQDNYNSSDTDDGHAFIDQTYQSVNLNIFLNTRIKGNFYWFSYLQAGVQGTHPFDDVRKSHTEIMMNKVNYKANRNMNIGLGFAFASNLGDPVIIPAIAFVYARPHYLINIDFPVKAEIEGIIAHGKWRPVAGVSFPSNTWYVKSIDQYFSTSGLTGYLGMRYKVLDFLYLHAKWQRGLGETFKQGTKTDRTEIGTFNGQSQFVMSLNIQMARVIPASGK